MYNDTYKTITEGINNLKKMCVHFNAIQSMKAEVLPVMLLLDDTNKFFKCQDFVSRIVLVISPTVGL